MTQNEKPRAITASQLTITALILLVILFLSDAANAAPCASGVIAVNQAPIRATPAAFGKPTGTTLKMGAKVKVAAVQGNFCKVTANGVTGWVSASAFATDADSSIYRAGKGEAVAVSSREAAAAGKGFNPEFEDAYKKKNATLDFASVDKLQGMSVSEEQLLKFRKSGVLGEGSRQ